MPESHERRVANNPVDRERSPLVEVTVDLADSRVCHECGQRGPVQLDCMDLYCHAPQIGYFEGGVDERPIPATRLEDGGHTVFDDPFSHPRRSIAGGVVGTRRARQRPVHLRPPTASPRAEPTASDRPCPRGGGGCWPGITRFLP